MKVTTPATDNPDLDVSSLIDMVFLLLVFFMVTSSLVQSEGDLGVRLPGMIQQAVSVDMPDEQLIEVRETGRVFLNGREFGSHDSDDLGDLIETLERYKLASTAAGNQALITIWPEPQARHQRVIDVLDACAAAGIEDVTFTSAIDS